MTEEKTKFLQRNNQTNIVRKKDKALAILSEIKEKLGHNDKLKLSRFIVEFFEPLYDDLEHLSEILKDPTKDDNNIECYNIRTGRVFTVSQCNYDRLREAMGSDIRIQEREGGLW